MYKIFCHLPNGELNLTEPELQSLFIALQKQHIAQSLFYDGVISTAKEFSEMMQDNSQWFYLFTQDVNLLPNPYLHNQAQSNLLNDVQLPQNIRGNAPLAFCWLNGHSGKTAMIHFAVFKNALHKAREIGLFATRMLLFASPEKPASFEFCAGIQPAPATTKEYCLDTLLGLTPKPFRHALNFIELLGFKRLCTIPQSILLNNQGQKKICAGVLTQLTRKDLLNPLPAL